MIGEDYRTDEPIARPGDASDWLLYGIVALFAILCAVGIAGALSVL